MEKLEIVWRFAVTSLMVWRLSRLLFKDTDWSQTPEAAGEESNSGRYWAGRVADLLCWASVWMSSQTATWVAYGFAGVFASWITLSGLSRLFALPAENARRSQGAEFCCMSGGDGMQAHHG